MAAEYLQRGMAVTFDESLAGCRGQIGTIEYVCHEQNRCIVDVEELGVKAVVLPRQVKALPGWQIGDNMLDYFASIHKGASSQNMPRGSDWMEWQLTRYYSRCVAKGWC